MSRQLTLVIHALHTGGAERVLARMANHWAAAGDEVTLITLDAVESDTLQLHPQVGRIGLDAMRPATSRWQGVLNNLGRLWQLRRAIRQAGARPVISFTDKMNVLTLLACRGLAVDVVIAERSQPAHQTLSPGWARLRRLTYPRCRALVVQTEAVAVACRALVGERPIYVIPNPAVPLAQPTPEFPAPRATGTRCVLCLGRLSREKGFDLLIRAFAQVAVQHGQWTLQIVGDGEQRSTLEDLIGELGLRGRVQLPGWSEQPGGLLQQADLFVLPSRYEGFPNVLLEAMASGLPVISFACDSGPSEIIRHDLDGLLIPPQDITALAAALDRLMSDATARERLGRRAVEVVARFAETAFYERWEQVLADLGPSAAESR